MRIVTALCVLAAACGGGNGGGGGDGGEVADSEPGTSPCGFEDRYLPYQVGYSWTWRVTDLGSGLQVTKIQTINPMITDPDVGETLVQETQKGTGTTIGYMRVEGDAVVRLKQEDKNEQGDLERTTIYDPYQVRLDEAEGRIGMGSTWDETYDETVFDAAGTELGTVTTSEHWEIIGVDVSCESPLGTFQCLHVKRTRTAGGVADKQFFFASGIGKVKEIGSNQVEELTACE